MIQKKTEGYLCQPFVPFAYNPSTWGKESVQGQPGLHSEAPALKKKNVNKQTNAPPKDVESKHILYICLSESPGELGSSKPK